MCRIHPPFRFDRERTPEIHLPVVVSDSGKPPKSGTATVDILILDENDNPPLFNAEYFSFNVKENEAPGTVVDRIAARDPDDGENGAVAYAILGDPSGQNGFFIIDKQSGVIKTTKILDREDQSIYRIHVMASDNGYPRMSSTTQVTIHVNDINDHPPIIHYPNSQENIVYASMTSRRGQLVAKIQASDKDIGPNGVLTYQIKNRKVDSLFDVTKSSGELYFRRGASPEETGVHKLQVAVADNGVPQSSATAFFNVIVTEVESDRETEDFAIHLVNKTYTAGFFKSERKGMSTVKERGCGIYLNFVSCARFRIARNLLPISC